MKKFTFLFILLFSIIRSDPAFCQDCQFNYTTRNDTLFMGTTAGISCDGYYYDCSVVVDLGDGDQIRWSEPNTGFHVYTCNGSFPVTVSGDFNLKFTVAINDFPSCSLQFSDNVFYNTANGKFTVRCFKTDACNNIMHYWKSNIFQQFGDTAMFSFPKEDSGTVQQICLSSLQPCFTDPVCQTVLLVPQNATVIDEPTSDSPSVDFFPNPAGNSMEMHVVNIKQEFQFSIWAIDGREVMNMKVLPSQWRSYSEIDLTDLPKGIYLVQITVPGKFSTFKKLMKL